WLALPFSRLAALVGEPAVGGVAVDPLLAAVEAEAVEDVQELLFPDHPHSPFCLGKAPDPLPRRLQAVLQVVVGGGILGVVLGVACLDVVEREHGLHRCSHGPDRPRFSSIHSCALSLLMPCLGSEHITRITLTVFLNSSWLVTPSKSDAKSFRSCA